MFDQLQASMARRQAAISGKKDRMEKKRDTIAITQNPETFRNQVRNSLVNNDKSAIIEDDDLSR